MTAILLQPPHETQKIKVYDEVHFFKAGLCSLQRLLDREGVFSSFNAIYPGVTTTIAFLLLATPGTNFLRTRSGIEFAYRSGTFIVSRIFRGRGTRRPCAKKGAANKLCGGNDRRKA